MTARVPSHRWFQLERAEDVLKDVLRDHGGVPAVPLLPVLLREEGVGVELVEDEGGDEVAVRVAELPLAVFEQDLGLRATAGRLEVAYLVDGLAISAEARYVLGRDGAVGGDGAPGNLGGELDGGHGSILSGRHGIRVVGSPGPPVGGQSSPSRALAEDRRRDIIRKTRSGLAVARARGRVGGRPRVVDEDREAVILARRERGESIRQIAAAVGVSVGTVHGTVARAQARATDVSGPALADSVNFTSRASDPSLRR